MFTNKALQGLTCLYRAGCAGVDNTLFPPVDDDCPLKSHGKRTTLSDALDPRSPDNVQTSVTFRK